MEVKPGEIVLIKDTDGEYYEAKLLWNFPNTDDWRIEWVAGPNDGYNSIARAHPDNSEEI